VGFSEADGVETHAFLYANGRMQDLGSLRNDPVRANAINDCGQIVGASAVNAFVRHAYLWEKGEMQGLNRLIAPDPTGHLEEAFDINDQGQIICLQIHATGSRERRLILLNPREAAPFSSELKRSPERMHRSEPRPEEAV